MNLRSLRAMALVSVVLVVGGVAVVLTAVALLSDWRFGFGLGGLVAVYGGYVAATKLDKRLADVGGAEATPIRKAA